MAAAQLHATGTKVIYADLPETPTLEDVARVLIRELPVLEVNLKGQN